MTPDRIRNWLCRKGRDRRGVVATEFALSAFLLTTVMVVSIELGNSMWQAMRVEHAARAGAGYGVIMPTDPSGMATAAQNALGAGVPATITAGLVCRCAGVELDCDSNPTCPDLSAPLRYARVTVTRNRDSILNIPGMPLPATLTGDAEIRIQ